MATATVRLCANDPTAEVEALRFAVTQTDCLAHGKLASISSMAQLALLALRQLEKPRDARSWKAIAQALSTISEDAEDLMDTINSHAEEVGCNFKAEVRHG